MAKILLRLCGIFLLMILTNCVKEKAPTSQSQEGIYKDPTAAIADRLEDLLNRMTLNEKVGQMTQVDRKFLKDINDIQKYSLGSLLSGGGSTPSNNSASGWADMYDQFQSIALKSRLGIPLIYGIDAVHGHNNVRGAVIFPHNIGMGCTRNPDLVEQAARITAIEVVGTGIDWTFGPCVAVPRDERWGRTYEGFGEDPELVRTMAAAAVRGFQGNDLADGTTNGINEGNTEVDEATLRAIHLPGYQAAIQAGVGSIMASFNSWNGEKVHGNKYLLTTVLKQELGFEGILVSDWAAIDQLPGDYASDIETAINAGLDMIMVPDKYEEFIAKLLNLVNQNRVPLSRIDDAVRRILRIKFKLGLFEKPFTNREFTSSIGSSYHRQVARECVRQSLVLLINNNHTLPIPKNLNRIHVAGQRADDLGSQCGGWTISWQGSEGNITTGTTILEAIKNTVSTQTNVTYSADGDNAAGADIGIACIGETPYAEGWGDRTDLNLSSEDIAVVKKLKSYDIPVIVILISGRPMIINSIFNYCDAVIAAWLPGTEGQGVADVLFGDYEPTGKLSHSWPINMTQVPINIGDPNYHPLFQYGFGLTY